MSGEASASVACHDLFVCFSVVGNSLVFDFATPLGSKVVFAVDEVLAGQDLHCVVLEERVVEEERGFARLARAGFQAGQARRSALLEATAGESVMGRW
jgi:hypothetical protein